MCEWLCCQLGSQKCTLNWIWIIKRQNNSISFCVYVCSCTSNLVGTVWERRLGSCPKFRSAVSFFSVLVCLFFNWNMQRRKHSVTCCRSANPITDLNTHADTLLIRPISERPFVSLSRIPDGINLHLHLPRTTSHRVGSISFGSPVCSASLHNFT